MVRRWPYVAAVLLVVALVGLAVFRPGADPPPRQAGPTVALPLPPTFGGWTRLDDAATAREQRALREAVDERSSDVASVVELFESEEDGRVRITAIVPVEGGPTSRSLRQDPAARLAEFLGGLRADRRTVDAGSLGGTLQCWSAPLDDFPNACAWADRWALAIVRYDAADLDLDEAAELTRTLRLDLAGAS